ncbi:hypothetical protein MKW98_009768 [Papaver atlanticum]|uniref:Chromo domain-containing protein n=1 Tax=Papaver atlanticum TaxID=357466 RepID=A0AAD4SYA8_9MAGN|nr:hypothetical protein MKW98_009768 [Papaver atlanticum]
MSEKKAPELEEGFYEIEDVRKKRVHKGKTQYLIKWLGWPESDNTWEPIENLQACLDVVAEFDKGLYEIEDVRAKRVHKGQTMYLIKWLGWPEEYNTWEPIENLKACLDAVSAFEKRLRSRGQKGNRKGTFAHPKKTQRVSSEEVLEEESTASVCGVSIATSMVLDPSVKSCSTEEVRQQYPNMSTEESKSRISSIPHDPSKVDLLKSFTKTLEEVTPSEQIRGRWDSSHVAPAEEMRIVGISTKPSPVITSTLQDLGTSTPTSALFLHPFTDLQQVQLRAQIFIYGSLSQGVTPDEQCMVSAFGGPDGGRSMWETAWSVARKKLQDQKSPLTPSLTIAKVPAENSTPVRAGGVGAPPSPMMLSPLPWER